MIQSLSVIMTTNSPFQLVERAVRDVGPIWMAAIHPTVVQGALVQSVSADFNRFQDDSAVEWFRGSTERSISFRGACAQYHACPNKIQFP
jgi:hypothetical protein